MSDRRVRIRAASALVCYGAQSFWAAWRTFAVGDDESILGCDSSLSTTREYKFMNSIIYIVGLVVIVAVILSYFGLR